MNERTDNIIDLITDYLTGDITSDGERELLSWIQQSDENQRLFLEWKELWLGAGNSDIMHRFSNEAAFRRFRQQKFSNDEIKDRKQQIKNKYMRVSTIWRWAAAAVIIPLLVTCTVVMYLQISNLQFGQVVLSTDEGQQSTIQLPDGSTIELQERSFVRYNTSDFAHGKRNVEFQGIAYFQIKSDPEHPFTVNTHDEEVRVLGTEFNFDSRPEDKLNIITLDHGKVEFTNKKTSLHHTITTGDVLTYNKEIDKFYTRHRSEEEIQQMAQARLKTSGEQPFVLENIDKTDDGYNIKVVFNEPIKPGTYHVRMSNDRTDINIESEKATRNNPFSAGNGTVEAPYLITSARQMVNMRSYIPRCKLTYFALGADIDLKGIDWRPLNDFYDDYSHWISFDGRNHVIRNLTPTVSCFYSSFFGVLCGECRNVGFENANISSTGMGAGVLGGYIGHKSYPGTTIVENCYFEGRVSSKSYAGGIGGVVGGRAIIRNCCSSVDVTSISSYAGGLLGKVRGSGLTMSHCYADGNVAGQHAGGIIAGGQDQYTGHSSYSDIIACNKSVYGNVSAHAVGVMLPSDTVQSIAFSNAMHVNGDAIAGGQPRDAIQQLTRRWPKVWYHTQF